MTDAEFEALLEEAIRSSGVVRYRHLCSGENTRPAPNSRADWRRFIIERRWVPSDTPLPSDYADRLPPLGGCCP